LCIFGEVWVPARRRSTLIRVGSAPASRPARPYFWIDANRPVQTSLHVAFACGSRELVDGFHAAALAAGGADNGPLDRARSTTRITTALTSSTPTATSRGGLPPARVGASLDSGAEICSTGVSEHAPGHGCISREETRMGSSVTTETHETEIESPHEQGSAQPLLELIRVLEERYRDLAFHGRSVSGYAAMTARELGLGAEQVERISLAGELHDVGKVGVDEVILRKPSKLSEDEWTQIERHPQIGADLLVGANLDDVALWVLAHHERPDGRGYPHGSAAKQIPVEAKILAVADAYDAMRSDRVYKEGMGHEAAAEEILGQAGAQFDAEVAEAFLQALSRLGLPAGVAER
jgi:hypothetical protein